MLRGIGCVGDEVEVVHFFQLTKCVRLVNALHPPTSHNIPVREFDPFKYFSSPHWERGAPDNAILATMVLIQSRSGIFGHMHSFVCSPNIVHGLTTVPQKHATFFFSPTI